MDYTITLDYSILVSHSIRQVTPAMRDIVCSRGRYERGSQRDYVRTFKIAEP